MAAWIVSCVAPGVPGGPTVASGPAARTWNVSPVRVVAPSAVTASW